MPDAGAAGRVCRRRPGLTVHRWVAGAVQASAASGAFPGWTGAEIHAALNETELSEGTFAVRQGAGASGRRTVRGRTTIRCWAGIGVSAGRWAGR